ncbi:MAG: CerR family C-terminal domain-containing protein [Thermogutta sp.]
MEDTRGRLLLAAGELFAERGFDGASAREICDRAGVNVAAINYYFGGKEALYVEAVKAAAPIFRAEAVFERQPSDPGQSDPGQLLADYIRLMLEHMIGQDTPSWKIKLIMREMLDPTPACEAFFRQHVLNNFRMLLGILERILPERVPEHRRYQIALSIVAQCTHYRAAGRLLEKIIPESLRPQFTVEHIARHITEFVFSALGLTPSFVDRWRGDDLDCERESEPALEEHKPIAASVPFLDIPGD